MPSPPPFVPLLRPHFDVFLLDPYRRGGHENRHLPADGPEADPAGFGQIPPTKPENALPHQRRQSGKLSIELLATLQS